MNLLSSLKRPFSDRKQKRKGRGASSGKGSTSTRGHKGQKSRKSYNPIRGFEGGQMPLYRRLPKFGFTNNQFKKRYRVFNLSDFKDFTEVTHKSLLEKKWIKKDDKVKVLSNGEPKKALHFKVDQMSKKAKQKVEKSGGKVELLSKEV